jgi:hypothetical protein
MLFYMKFNNLSLHSSIPYVAVLFLTFVFYPELFFVKSAPLVADHWQQHYPWAMLLHDSLRAGSLPFWTSLIHCGFPLAAEGQIGVFYLPNLILSLLLPARVAYSYSFVLHALIVGWGILLYAKQMGLKKDSSFIAAAIYLFGTSYGGAYYNITSLKTLAWFPWILFFMDRFLECEKKRNLLGLAVVVSLSLLAGYLQVAILAVLMAIFFVFSRLFFFCPDTYAGKKHKLRSLLGMLAAIAVGFSIASPQLLLTYAIAIQSNRALASEGYAYVGSLFPGALLTVVFPLLQGLFRGNSLYLGVFSVALFLAAVLSKKTQNDLKVYGIWITFVAFALLMALGQWSPLYIALVKLTNFYSFRTPAKFLIFINFGISLLCGFGYQKIVESSHSEDRSYRRRVAGWSIAMFLTGLGIFTFFHFMLTRARSMFELAGEWYIHRFVYQQPGHPKSIESYREKLDQMLDQASALFSLNDPWIVWNVFFLVLGIALMALFPRVQKHFRFWLILGMTFLFADLYIFSYYDIRSDFATYRQIDGTSESLFKKLDSLGRDRAGRLFNLYNEGNFEDLVPNANMLYEIEAVGVYSPFVLSRYYESIGTLGNVNDSNFAHEIVPEYVLNRLNLLHFLDVGIVRSKKPLMHPQLTEISEARGANDFWYRNVGPHARAHFLTQVEYFSTWQDLKALLLARGFDPTKRLLLEKEDARDIPIFSSIDIQAKPSIQKIEDTDTLKRWRLTTDTPGFFVISEILYPGWRAKINGIESKLLAAYGLFQGVFIPEAGDFDLEFAFRPAYTVFSRAQKNKKEF